MTDRWIAIAALDEAPVIAGVVAPLVAAGYQVAVTDDGSTDGTFDALAGTGVHRLRHAVNLGQGAALQTAITYALVRGAAQIATFDADGQHRADDVAPLFAALDDGAEVALGSRFQDDAGGAAIPGSRRWLLRLATRYVRLASGLAVTDAHNGLRAFSRAAARRLRITRRRSGHATELLEQIAALGLRWVEVPVTIDYPARARAKGQRAADALLVVTEDLLTR